MGNKLGHIFSFAAAFIFSFAVMLFSGCEKSSDRTPELTLPIIATLETTGISDTSAISGGKVLSSGSVPLIARGVCWNLEGNPTVNDPKTDNGTGMGAFTSIITGLEEGTAYIVRAYAINSAGIAYGSQEIFTTITFPTVATSEVTEISRTTATSGGQVVFCGGASVSSRGVCWSTAENPTIRDSRTLDGRNTGFFKSALTGLQVNTTFYVRAYATNSKGTAYGTQVSFRTNK